MCWARFLQNRLCGLCLPWVFKGHCLQQSLCLHFSCTSRAQMWWLPHSAGCLFFCIDLPWPLSPCLREALHLRGPPPGGPLCELPHLRGPRVLRLPMAGLGSWPTSIFPKPSSWETLGFATGQAGRETSAINCPRVCGPLILPVQMMDLGNSRWLSCWLCLHLNLCSD